MAHPARSEFKPFIAPSQSPAEFTGKAIILGIIFGIIFGASTVYLALRAGLTVSASIPIAVLAIAVFKRIGNSTILENNIVQTIGSAGESIAGGIVFTLPALIFLADGERYFSYFTILTLGMTGGILGVLFMIPLRRALIVREHGHLPYPEGTACADVLVAGEKGGSFAGKVFAGLGVAFAYKALMSIAGLWKDVPSWGTSKTAAFPNAEVSAEITPEYLGVGYIIGPRIAGNLVAGGVLAYLVLIPLIYLVGENLPAVLKPGVGTALIRDMSPGQLRLGYVRYIGAGAVAAAGMITLIRTLPTIASAFKESFGSLKAIGSGGAQSRTERDIPITWVVVGSLVLVLIIALLPQLPGTLGGRIFMGVLVVIFGFFFVTVSSRITGLIGTSSNPISGMTIATLMATCLIFVAMGWTGETYQAVALCVGGIVCVAAANGGATSQDLKTGYIVGATPFYQQIGLVIGVATSALAIGWTLKTLDNSMAFQGVAHAIGTDRYSAPQATLMATIIQGLLAQNLPWGLVFVGMFIAVVMELCGVNSLSFAVGAYLPLSTTAPIWVGGMMRVLVGKLTGEKEESELSSGMLYSTGLVAGGSLTGILIALLAGIPTRTLLDGATVEVSLADRFMSLIGTGKLAAQGSFAAATKYWEHMGGMADLIGILMFGVLCFLLVSAARKKLEV